MTDYIVSGGTTSLTLNSGDTATVLSGGTAASTTINSGGLLAIRSGGSALATTVSSGGLQSVSSGGIAVFTTISGGGDQLLSGGSAVDTTVSSGGEEFLEAGAVGTATTIGNGGLEVVTPGDIASGTNVASGGILLVMPGATVNGTISATGADVVSTGIVLQSGTQVVSGPILRLSGAVIQIRETEYVFSGGTDIGAVLSGIQTVFGGTAIGTTIRGGEQALELGGTAISTTISSGGQQLVDIVGGLAVSATIDSGGSQFVFGGGLAVNTAIDNGGSQFIELAGSATATTISSGGTETASSGSTATGTTIISGGIATIFSGGVATNATLSGGMLDLQSGAVTSGTIGFSGGGMLAIDGATLPLAPALLTSAVIDGFTSGDTIDLTGIAFDSAGSAVLGAGNALQITEGGKTHALQLDPSQSFAGDGFGLHSDGASGTDITMSGPVLTTLVNFDGNDGMFPESGLIADAAGDLFGTTEEGGSIGIGTVFEIAKTNGGYAGTPTTLVNFHGIDGEGPQSSLIADAAGDLFGTTSDGGAATPPNNDGTAFEILKTGSTYASAPTTLVSFNGFSPTGGLVADAAGNLFGTTAVAVAVQSADGTVFEIAKTGSTYASAPTTLAAFDNNNHGFGLVADAAGNLFGTFLQGGTSGDGMVFEIAKTGGTYASTPTILARFDGTDGAAPEGELVADAAGDLFGTTTEGGSNNLGTVFEIAKTGSTYAGTPTVLASFTENRLPAGALIIDTAGDLFGTTLTGGTNGGSTGDGTVFEIAKTGAGYASTPITLVNFDVSNGELPGGDLIADAAGNLFGTTGEGGANGDGTVFELSGVGFQVGPPAPSGLTLAPASDSGVQGDDITNVTTPTITGQGQAGDTVKLFDGSTLVGSATVGGNGAWQITTSLLSDGQHSLTATETGGGGTSVASSPLGLTIDAPQIDWTNWTSGQSGSAAGAISPLGITVSYAGEVEGLTANYPSWGPASSFTGGIVGNAPPSSGGAIRLFGGNSNVDTVTFSTPVTDPVMAIWSLGGSGTVASFDFSPNEPFVIEGGGPSNEYRGSSITASGNDVSGDEGNGIIEFQGTFSQITWTNPQFEDWYEFTIGVPQASAPAPSGLTLDPSTDSGTQGDDITNVTQPEIDGHGQAGDTIDLYDGATLVGSATAGSSGAWQITTSRLSNGQHSLTATETDPAGNTSSASAALALTIDTTPPAAPTGLALDPSTDSGPLGDDVTDVTAPQIDGQGVAGDTVKLFEDSTFLGSGTVAGDGTWQITATALADGIHSLTTSQSDIAGNVSAASAPLSLNIVNVQPLISTVSWNDTTQIVVIDGSNFGSQSPYDGDSSFINIDKLGSGNFSAGFAGGGFFDSVSLNVTSWTNNQIVIHGFTGSYGSGSFVFNPGDQATIYIANTSQNPAPAFPRGNAFPANITLTIPGTVVVPAPSALTLDPSTDSGVLGDGITNVTRPEIDGQGQAGDTVELFDGTTPLGGGIVAGNGAWQITSSTLSDGKYSLTASETDTSGNTSTASAPVTVTIDTTIPPPPSGLMLDLSTDSGVQGDDITDVSTPAIDGQGQAGDTVKLLAGTTLVGSATVGGNGAWQITTSTLAGGQQSLTASETDSAGNTSTASAALVVTIDTAPPPAPAGLALDPSSDSGVTGDDLTNAARPEIDGQGQARDTVKLFDGATLVGSATVGGNGAWQITTSPLNDGRHTLTATETDTAGNTGTASSPLVVTIDTTPPPAPAGLALDPSSAPGTAGDAVTTDTSPTLDGDGEVGDTVSLYESDVIAGTGIVDANGRWSIGATALAPGAHDFTATQTDPAGNVGAASASYALTIAEQQIAPNPANPALLRSASNALIAGTGGSDLLGIIGSHDTVVGGSGDDELVLFVNSSLLDGGSGNNTIFVFGGNDTVTGGGGNNQVYIDANDVLTDGPGVFHDTVSSFSQSTGDRIHLTADTASDALAHATAVNGGKDTLISLANGSTILLQGVGHVDQSFFS